MIADEFPEIFYAPIAKKVEFEINNGVSVLVDKWSTETVTLTVNRSKYNEMWIITYLLKTEFEKIIQQKKRSLNKQQEPKWPIIMNNIASGHSWIDSWFLIYLASDFAICHREHYFIFYFSFFFLTVKSDECSIFPDED